MLYQHPVRPSLNAALPHDMYITQKEMGKENNLKWGNRWTYPQQAIGSENGLEPKGDVEQVNGRNG